MEDILKVLGRKICTLREGRDMTQEKFAKLLGIRLGYLKQIEFGEMNIDILLVFKIAAVFKVKPQEMFSGPE